MKSSDKSAVKSAKKTTKPLRVLVLMHEDLIPPDSIRGLPPIEVARFRTEFDVVKGLRDLGHDVRKLGVYDDLSVLRKAIDTWKPDIAFNLLEEFHGNILYHHNIVAYLELKRVPYTGCNPRGLILSHDKALSKKVLHFHRIPVPEFAVFPLGKKPRRPKKLAFPLIVKSVIADASAGISQASLVNTDDKLTERVKFIHKRLGHDAIVERYIDGRELYVGVMGHARLKVLPVWEMVFRNMPENAANIATESVKWDFAYQKRRGITTKAARGLDPAVQERINKLCKRAYRRLDLSGYARLDFRLGEDSKLWLLEANANPNIAREEDFAESAKASGIAYPALLDRFLRAGLRRAAAREA